jgi:hypothetical protein
VLARCNNCCCCCDVSGKALCAKFATQHALTCELAPAVATATDADLAAAAAAAAACAPLHNLGSVRTVGTCQRPYQHTLYQSLFIFVIMNARAQKRSAADTNSNPLLQANILQRVLDYVGRGHWYFVSTVSSLWKDVYERVQSQTTAVLRHNIVPGTKMTLFSSAFESPFRLRLVHSRCLYCWMDLLKREYLLGRYASKATLESAHELTLIRYSSDILTGAVRSGDISKVIWLYTEQHCKLGDH